MPRTRKSKSKAPVGNPQTPPDQKSRLELLLLSKVVLQLICAEKHLTQTGGSTL
jgi:hypothetical protein